MIRADERPFGPGPDGPERAEFELPSAAADEREALVAEPQERATPSSPAADRSTPNHIAAERSRDEYYDLLLRKTAEFDNYRRRVERERRELSDYVAGEFVKELLPVIDDFDRALAADATTGAFREGVELIRRRLMEVLAKRGVTVLDPLGEAFDPHQHEAVARVPAAGRRDGEIVEVFSRGYKLGDRLLRPAMVKVATA
jgi:molecular chaperone GrpE